MDGDPGFSSGDKLPTGLDVDLALAIERDELFLVYQPTVNFVTNTFVGVEALIRWRTPTKGVLLPEAFISRFEASNLLAALSRWTLPTACAQGVIWHDKGYRFSVSVNVSLHEFNLHDFIDAVSDALSQSRLEPAGLVLEFAQATLLRDCELTATRLSQLRQLGVRVAVDDFVPGKSSLEELANFNLDFVKLDRLFISEITSSGTDVAALVHSLVDDAELHHVQIVASGIENIGQRDQLANERVRVGQGFLFSRPHEADEIDNFLQDFSIFSGKLL
jgi:EAL domain-containing protein (putative c-di-GMP-specific phosphodiesterase class I)